MLKEPNLEDRKWFEHLLEQSKNNISHFQYQIEQMTKEYDLEVDLKKDRVKYGDPILNEKLGIEW